MVRATLPFCGTPRERVLPSWWQLGDRGAGPLLHSDPLAEFGEGLGGAGRAISVAYVAQVDTLAQAGQLLKFDPAFAEADFFAHTTLNDHMDHLFSYSSWPSPSPGKCILYAKSGAFGSISINHCFRMSYVPTSTNAGSTTRSQYPELGRICRVCDDFPPLWQYSLDKTAPYSHHLCKYFTIPAHQTRHPTRSGRPSYAGVH